jgi:flagella basal body P-ring formation protein FlgA
MTATLAALVFAPPSHAGADASLERALRAQRPDVERWETQPHDASLATDSEVVAVGRIGARTAARHRDGRVRWYSVTGYRAVPVITQSVEPGATLDVAVTRVEQREVVADACIPADFAAGGRWRATRRLAANAALCAHDVELAPDVERERPVTLTVERAGVSVSRELTAAADARAGERVRLRDRASGANLIAIVTGPGTARVLQEHR